MSETEQDGTEVEQSNDDWSGKYLLWGEEFRLKIEAEGRQSICQRGLEVAKEAARAHFRSEDKFKPSKTEPQWRHMAKTTATFENEHATMDVELRSDSHYHEDAEALFSQIGEELEDPTGTKEITIMTTDDWERTDSEVPMTDGGTEIEPPERTDTPTVRTKPEDKVITGCRDCGFVAAIETSDYQAIRGGPQDPGFQHYDETQHNVGSFEPTDGGELDELWRRAFYGGDAEAIDGKRVFDMGAPERVSADD